MRRLLLEGDFPGERDILSEERERRVRRRRGFRALLPSSWLFGRTGVVILMVFLVGGLGWFGFRNLGDSRVDSGPPVPSGRSLPVPDRQRDLTSSEHSLAARYGEPLYMGSGGFPVVRVEGTGEIRPLTSFEMEFESAFSRLQVAGSRVIEVPGPRGWGMWWRDMSEPNALRPLVSFERRSWALRQERELTRVARGISLGMRLISDIELEVWREGLGLPFLDLVSQVKGPYPPALHGHWSAVPDMWVCDVLLERELHQGITPGCPGDEYLDALRDVWADAGLVVQRMERVARMMHYVDSMSSRDYYQSSVRSDLSYEVIDLSPQHNPV